MARRVVLYLLFLQCPFVFSLLHRIFSYNNICLINVIYKKMNVEDRKEAQLHTHIIYPIEISVRGEGKIILTQYVHI